MQTQIGRCVNVRNLQLIDCTFADQSVCVHGMSGKHFETSCLVFGKPVSESETHVEEELAVLLHYNNLHFKSFVAFHIKDINLTC